VEVILIPQGIGIRKEGTAKIKDIGTEPRAVPRKTVAIMVRY
jgi:hypothetical protein